MIPVKESDLLEIVGVNGEACGPCGESPPVCCFNGEHYFPLDMYVVEDGSAFLSGYFENKSSIDEYHNRGLLTLFEKSIPFAPNSRILYVSLKFLDLATKVCPEVSIDNWVNTSREPSRLASCLPEAEVSSIRKTWAQGITHYAEGRMKEVFSDDVALGTLNDVLEVCEYAFRADTTNNLHSWLLSGMVKRHIVANVEGPDFSYENFLRIIPRKFHLEQGEFIAQMGLLEKELRSR